jgi:extracellular elastinolytic metalloproteinase
MYLNFRSTWNGALAPNVASNKDASLKSLFTLLNTVHDILYQFGFNELSGNFQQNNYGRGGLGNDRVIVSSQSYSGVNNANFATPPGTIITEADGQSGRMNMYLWTLTSPGRDGSLDSMIPIHEYIHGVSNRLTGGPANSACLQALESGGMGEGWSDAIAIFLTRKASDTAATNVALGWYVANTPRNGRGVRRYPYSTSMAVNPLVFSGLNIERTVHRIGEYWCSMLYEVYWNLVKLLGFTANWMDAKQIKGNIVAMQIVLGGVLILKPDEASTLQSYVHTSSRRHPTSGTPFF